MVYSREFCDSCCNKDLAQKVMSAFEYGTGFNMFYPAQRKCSLLIADDISGRKVAFNAIMEARKTNSKDRSVK